MYFIYLSIEREVTLNTLKLNTQNKYKNFIKVDSGQH